MSTIILTLRETQAAAYNYDTAGRPGAMKHATYGNSVQVDLTYNSRLQIGQYQVSGFQAPFGTMGATMSYYDDGRTNTAYDLNDSRFDRKYEFDFAARLKEAYTGPEAHGASAPPIPQAISPYRQSYTYDAWNNVTLRSGRIWSVSQDLETASYGSDSKRQGWGYDAAGNATWTGYSDGARTYDAAGRPSTFISGQVWQVYPNWPSGHPDAPALESQDTFDGTGQVAKHVATTRHDDTYDSGGGNLVYTMSDTTTSTFYLHSTVLGGKGIAELDQVGVKAKGYVYAGGARMATQTVYGSSNSVQIESTNPVTGAAIVTNVNGSSATRQEPDPLGRDLAEAVVDPTVVVDPLAGSKFNEPMPIEYTGGPSAEYEQANADWAHDMALRSLDTAIKNNYKATSQLILEKNPNIGVRTSGGRTLYGNDAAHYLDTVSKSYGEDTSSSDQNEHDVASPYNMTIYGGPEVFVDPQNLLNAAHRTQVQDGINNAKQLAAKTRCGGFVDAVLQRAASQIRWSSFDYVVFSRTDDTARGPSEVLYIFDIRSNKVSRLTPEGMSASSPRWLVLDREILFSCTHSPSTSPLRHISSEWFICNGLSVRGVRVPVSASPVISSIAQVLTATSVAKIHLSV